jgi:uncharacterized protein YeaO (DUF488 family)
MLYTGSTSTPEAHRGTVLDVCRPGSAFAPSPELQADVDAGRCGWRQLERRYTEEMRTCYRNDPELWIDLVEQAAVEDVTLVGPAQGEEASVRCHRRILYDLLCAVAAGVGAWIDPDLDELGVTLLESRRKAVMRERGLSLTCPVCLRPAPAELAIQGRYGYGYCSHACLDADVARWKAQLWSAGSGRRP